MRASLALAGPGLAKARDAWGAHAAHERSDGTWYVALYVATPGLTLGGEGTGATYEAALAAASAELRARSVRAVA